MEVYTSHDNAKEEGEIYRSGTEIVFSAPINDRTAFRLVRLIRETVKEIKDAADSAASALPAKVKDCELVDVKVTPKPITLILSTCGGTIHAAWAIVDTVLNSEVEIHTVVSGFVASAGSLVSLAGKRRFMYKHAHMLIHEVRGGSWGKFSDMRDQLENTDKLMTSIVTFYVERTKMDEDTLRGLLSRDRYWDHKECLDNGLIDEVL